MDSSEIEKRRQASEREDRVYLPPSEVEKRKLLYETEDELWKLIKKKLWWSTVIFGVLGVVGVPFLIYTLVERQVNQVAVVPLKAVEKKLTEAEIQADRAKKSASDAQAAADQATAQVENLKGKATGVEKQYGLLTEQINQTAKTAEVRSGQDFEATQKRIAKLEALVKNMGADNEATKNAYAEYKKEIDKVTAETARQQKRFNENSRYTVMIRYPSSEQRPLAEKVQNELINVGFKAQLITPPPPGVQGSPWSPWGPSTDPATGEPWKGNTLAYMPDNEMKAREILAQIKPIIRDVQLQLPEPPKFPEPPKIPSALGRPPPQPPQPPSTEVLYRTTFLLNLGS